LNQTIGQRGFAMVNVRNDRKISDVIHQGRSASVCGSKIQKRKRARLVMTRPEPTIFGNCDGWGFIVGKLAQMHSPKISLGKSLLQCNTHFIHKLHTGLETSR
jgi:hypothetical protein